MFTTIASEISRDPADPRTVPDWARRFRLAPEEVNCEVRHKTGLTFRQWRGQIRMTQARILLMLGHPIGEVARSLGYASTASFSKVFRAGHDLSPRTYRTLVNTRAGS